MNQSRAKILEQFYQSCAVPIVITTNELELSIPTASTDEVNIFVGDDPNFPVPCRRPGKHPTQGGSQIEAIDCRVSLEIRSGQQPHPLNGRALRIVLSQ